MNTIKARGDRLPSLNTKLEMTYVDLLQWASKTFGIQDHADYIHDAVVNMLEDTSAHSEQVRALSDQAFMGLWRLQAQKSYALAQHNRIGRFMKQVSFATDEAQLGPEDSIARARAMVRYMLPFVPFAARKVLHHLYILGETSGECSRSLGLSRGTVERIKYGAINRLGKLVKQGSI